MRRLLTWVVVLLLATTGVATAQVPTTGTIRVAVTDSAGLPIPGATVSAAADDSTTTRIAVTDVGGMAELSSLNPSREYVLTVELQGFQTVSQEAILVRAGQSVALDLELTVGGVDESILITAATPEVDVTSAVVAEDITLQLT